MIVEILPAEPCPVTLCYLMDTPPKIFKFPAKIFLVAFIVAAATLGCGTMTSHQNQWYDWDASWSRGDLAHVSMTRSTSPQEIRQAAVQRGSVATKQSSRSTSGPRVSVQERPRVRVASKQTRANQGTVRYGDLERPKSKKRRSTGASPDTRTTPATVPSTNDLKTTKAARDLGLGNGSPSSEFLSAATRLLGIKDGFLHKSFLRHLLSVSAIELKLKAPHNVYAGLVFEHFRGKGREVMSPKPGDLVFFSTPVSDDRAPEDRFTAAAVLEAIEPGGVYRCIGWVLGKVQRFKMDPRRPKLRRDERTGERINDVIRERSMGEGSSQPALAGQLLIGFLRL